MLNRKQLTSIIFALAGLALTAPMIAAEIEKEGEQQLLNAPLNWEQLKLFNQNINWDVCYHYYLELRSTFEAERIAKQLTRKMLLFLNSNGNSFYVNLAPQKIAPLKCYMDLMKSLKVSLEPLHALMERLIKEEQRRR